MKKMSPDVKDVKKKKDVKVVKDINFIIYVD